MFIAVSIFAQSPIEKGLESIKMPVIKAQLEFLSSDWMEGREIGERGELLSSDYIASIMKSYELEPYKSSYFQEFTVVNYKKSKDQKFTIIKNGKNHKEEIVLSNETDFMIEGGRISKNLLGNLVFVGYGLKLPKLKYDDFKGLDLKGKFLVKFNGYPGFKNKGSELHKKFAPKNRAESRKYYNQIYKIAKEKGALGIITIVPEKGINYHVKKSVERYKSKMYEGDKPLKPFGSKRFYLAGRKFPNSLMTVAVSPRVGELLLRDVNIQTKNYFKGKVTKNNSKFIRGIKVNIHRKVDTKLVKCRNVAGVLKGKDTTQCIIVGAHYDHLGKYNGYVWNGADDNGSGVIGMLNIARAMKNSGVKPEKNIVFVAFTGEEKGLLGSRYFANKLDDPSKVKYMLNLDMISRDSKKDTLGNTCAMIIKKHKKLRSYIEKANKDYNLELKLKFWESEGTSGGSDHAPFAQRGIPFNFFWAGWHNDYHKPTDEIEKINWDKMLKLTKLGFIHVYMIDKDGL